MAGVRSLAKVLRKRRDEFEELERKRFWKASVYTLFHAKGDYRLYIHM